MATNVHWIFLCFMLNVMDRVRTQEGTGVCDSNPCFNSGICMEQINGYSCVCVSGYVGAHCEISDFCSSNPCQNGGSCMDMSICVCNSGFEGAYCEVPPTMTSPIVPSTLPDKKWHYCQDFPCKNGATCLPLGGSDEFLCACPPNFVGWKCETELEPLEPSKVTFEGSLSFNATGCNGPHPEEFFNEVDPNPQYLISTNTLPSEGFTGGQLAKRQVPILSLNLSDVCRVLTPDLQLSEQPDQYDFRAILQNNNLDQSEHGYPGVIFNVIDSDNFDFLLFNIDDSYTYNVDACYFLGFVMKGKGVVTGNGTCSYKEDPYKLRVGQAVTVAATVGKQATVSFLLEDSVTWTPHFPLKPQVGVMSLNQVFTEIQFSNMTIDLKGAPATPAVTKVFPTYGPAAGGTLITLTGSRLREHYSGQADTYNEPIVYIGKRLCRLESYDYGQIVVSTPAFFDQTAITSTLPEDERGLDNQIQITVALRQDQGRVFFPVMPKDAKFTYKADPTIDRFYPNRTILAGGIGITFEGSNLDSVATHVLRLTMVHLRNETGSFDIINTTTFTSTCVVLSATRMRCPTPHITLPPVFISLTELDTAPAPGRRRREEASKAGGGRYRREEQRAISQHEVSNERLEFYVSVESDGVITYEENTPENAFRVDRNPKFSQFEPLVKFYDPNAANPRITIQGEYLRVGATEADYKVFVGRKACEDVMLTDKRASCLPPGSEPTDLPDASPTLRRTGQPLVMIHVGYLQAYIGHLDYTGERRTSGAAVTSPVTTLLMLSVIMSRHIIG